MRAFQSALTKSRLADLGFVGPKYTWRNGRQGNDFSKVRLDRVAANVEWCTLFNMAQVEVLVQPISDHNPIMVTMSHANDRIWKKNKVFRFEASWAKNKEQGGVIKQVWCAKKTTECPWHIVKGNLNGCRRALKQWVRKQANSGDLLIQDKLQKLQHSQMLRITSPWKQNIQLRRSYMLSLNKKI
jgi:hypothetical protein